jgi:hypothetical protein
MGLDQCARDGEPEAGTRDMVSGGRLDSEVLVEQGNQVFGRDPDPLVGDGHHDHLRADLAPDDH